MTIEIVVVFVIGVLVGAGLLSLIRFLVYYFRSPSKSWAKIGKASDEAFNEGFNETFEASFEKMLESVGYYDDDEEDDDE